MGKLDVFFVIPTNMPDFKGNRIQDAIEPPAKARFMAAYLMRRNVSVALIDPNVTNQTPEQVAEEVAAAEPQLVMLPVYGFNPSASTQTMPSARKHAEAIKERAPNTPIIMSGTHPAAIPETTLDTEPAVDYVCGGEGPITVHELLQALKFGGNVGNVRSLWYRHNGGVLHTPPAPLIDLNAEPVSREAWRLMDPRKYRAHHWQAFYKGWAGRGPYANPYAREGCPFHCNFCNIQAPFREGELLQARQNINSYRALRPELFLEEVTFLVEEFGTRLFKIPDEMFGLGDYPLHLARLIRDRFGDALNFWAYYRVDTCRPEELELLRSAGFRWLPLGIEAANSTVRSGQDKKFSDERIYEIVARMKSAGISLALNYIFGLPEDTMDSMQATFNLACELNGHYGNFYCCQALPGAELYREAKASNYPLPERSGGPGWVGHAQYSYESEPYYAGTALTPAQVLRFRDEAHRQYYTRPAYRAMLLADSDFGAVALASINEWMQTIAPDSLKRRLLENDVLGGKHK